MGKLKGFLEFNRKEEKLILCKERIKNYNEFTKKLSPTELNNQGARCMNCGTPFCHSGCPLGNFIPDFNQYVYEGKWKKALEILQSTNNFPEFTGRLCPAPCEQACVLGIIKPPITIENIEKNIVERGFIKGWIKAQIPKIRTNKTIAIIGSGPAGLAAAQQLNRAGHTVTVFEREDAIGGLLRYGIPNFKIEKEIINRRITILKEEGIIFRTNTNVGVNYKVENLKKFNAILLCGGATKARKLSLKGSNLKGVQQAIDFLTQQTKTLFNKKITSTKITAKNKNVIVIGGGDTGADCIGTSNRQGAKSVTNFEIMPKPPENRSKSTPWPYWPLKLKTSSSHREGCNRNWLIATKEFIGDPNGNLTAIKTVTVKWIKENNKNSLIEIPNSEKIWPCDLALLALGFTGPETTLATKLNITINEQNNYEATNYQTNIPHIFVAGDMRRGQSLIVWAIAEGREAAKKIDEYLMGHSILPSKGEGDLPKL